MRSNKRSIENKAIFLGTDFNTFDSAPKNGCNHIELIINNLKGIVNNKKIGNYEEGIVMMKYSDLVVKKHTELIDNKN